MKVVNSAAALLSKASHSDELVARINHSNLICDFKTWYRLLHKNELENMRRTLIAGIGDYLMRVVGSVPMGLYITFTWELEDSEEEIVDDFDEEDDIDDEVNSEEDDVELELSGEDGEEPWEMNEVEAEGYAQL